MTVEIAAVGRPRKLPQLRGLPRTSGVLHYSVFQNHATNPNPNPNPYEFLCHGSFRGNYRDNCRGLPSKPWN